MIFKHCLIIFLSFNLINTKAVLREDAEGLADPGDNKDDGKDDFGSLLKKLAGYLDENENKTDALISKVEDLFDFIVNASGEPSKVSHPRVENNKVLRNAGKWLTDLYKPGSWNNREYEYEYEYEYINESNHERQSHCDSHCKRHRHCRPCKLSARPQKDKLALGGGDDDYTVVDEFVNKISLTRVPDTMAGRGHATIQYFFDKQSYDDIIEYRLRSAMNKIEQASCVRFRSLQAEPQRSGYHATLLRVTNPNNQRECSHEPSIDREENIAQLVLGLDCLQERDILHSLLHAIGFNDEVSHPHRDQYVRVQWDNIQPKYRKLFRIQANENFAETPVEYDPLSIMHFHARAFSSNGQPTILPVMPGLTIDPSNELSTLDKMKLRMMFGQYCNRRRLSELMDSCKLVMTKDGNDNDAGAGADEENNIAMEKAEDPENEEE